MKRIVDDMREEEVIATLFNFPEEIDRHTITEDLFYHQTHKLALRAFRERGPSMATVMEVYPETEWDNIASGSLSSAGLPASLSILRTHAQARDILKALGAVMDLTDPSEIVETAITAASSVASSVAHGCGNQADESNALDVLEAYSRNQHQIQCGIHEALYIKRKQLVYIGARPGCGKTAILGQIASTLMAQEPGRVVIYSLEMESGELLHRLACFHAGEYLHPQANRRSLLDHMAEWMKGRQFTIDDRSATSIDEIEATSAAMVAKGPVSMIGIDYASLIVGGSGERRSEQVASISRRLKAMAKRLNVPVVVLAQLKREETERPGSSSFAETDQITRDADQLWLLSCDEAHIEFANRPISFRKSKCRGGSCISLELFFKAPQMTFKVREISDVPGDKP